MPGAVGDGEMAEILGARHFGFAVPGVFHHQFLDDVRRGIAAKGVEIDVKRQPLFVHRLLQDGVTSTATLPSSVR